MEKKIFALYNEDLDIVMVLKAVDERATATCMDLLLKHFEMGEWVLMKNIEFDPLGGPKEFLGTIESQLEHQAKQAPSDYQRGFVKGIKWTKTEFQKVFKI